MSETGVSTVELKLADIGAFRGADVEAPIAPSDRQASPEPSDAITNFRVALVTMPFGCCFRPSVQLGLLKAIGRQAGFPVDDYYFNLDMAAQLGLEFFDKVESEECGFTGDWLFTIAAFGEQASRADYVAAYPGEVARIMEATGMDVAAMNDLRERVMPQFVDACLDRIDWESYEAIGFTSTFQQNVASLALARRIKEKYPHVAIIFGGSTLAGEMGVEYARAFPYIDFVVNGEADDIFPDLLTRLAEGRETDDLLGMTTRRGDCVSFLGPAAQVVGLDRLPIPDYDTYYDTARRYGLDTEADLLEVRGLKLELRAIPIEGSRGCWWGEKAHCTFCGFNKTTMAYRSKSPERVLSEVEQLSVRYGRKMFMAVDSILDMKYINGLFGPLEASDEGYGFFFFTKSNMTREQVRTLATGGLRVMFPGIESLNSHVLKLMRKGVTRLQNVNTIKWATYYGIEVGYFLLHGFPGETAGDYAEELDTVHRIPHLIPPSGIHRLRIDRFSPNFWDKELFPVKWQRPVPAYGYIYPPHVNLEEAAYFFEYETDVALVPEEAHAEMRAEVETWQGAWYSGVRSTLTYRQADGDIVIEDNRVGLDAPRFYTVVGADAEIYEACSSAPRTAVQVCAALSLECRAEPPDELSVAAACDAFCEYGLMISEGGKYLSLALPAEPGL